MINDAVSGTTLVAGQARRTESPVSSGPSSSRLKGGVAALVGAVFLIGAGLGGAVYVIAKRTESSATARAGETPAAEQPGSTIVTASASAEVVVGPTVEPQPASPPPSSETAIASSAPTASASLRPRPTQRPSLPPPKTAAPCVIDTFTMRCK